jgi:superfamily II DNA/RNA helicase
MKFDAIINKLDITLNDMQQAAYKAISSDEKDVVVLSPTGSGKTLAYLLPLVELIDVENDNVQAVVIVPGRELAAQSAKVLQNMGAGLRSMACYGGRMAMEEHRKMKDVKPQIVFATPGRLNDHLTKQNVNPHAIKYLVIDEFDKCLEMGFMDEMMDIMGKLPALKHRILLSATDSDVIPGFVHMKNAARIDFQNKEEQVSDRVRIYSVRSESKDKLETLGKLLLSFGDASTIVFLNYRDSVVRTDEYLHSLGFTTSAYHGGLDQKQREDALYKFANGSANILVSTDLASRGLDIPEVENVVHYHLPETEDNYIHRVGRTARWDSVGRAFFLLGPDENIPEYVEDNPVIFEIPSDLPKLCKPRNTTIYVGKGKKDKISKGDIVGFLCKKGGLQSDEVGRIDVNDRYAYVAVRREKLQQVLRQVQGEKIKGIKTVVEPVR